MALSRRAALETSVGALAMGLIAGCTADESGSADENEDDGSEPAADDGSDSSDPETHSLELLAEEEIDHDHACGHAEFDDRTPLEAGSSADDEPTVTDTHVIWALTYEGDSGYVTFDAAAHFFDGPFVFYTADGSATPVVGTEIADEPVDDDACADLDEYVVVEPEDGEIVLEVTAS